jgi:hypothetical protein
LAGSSGLAELGQVLVHAADAFEVVGIGELGQHHALHGVVGDARHVLFDLVEDEADAQQAGVAVGLEGAAAW